MRRGLSSPPKQASATKTQVPRKHRREISDPTLEKTLQPHLRFPASGSAMGDAGLGCEPLHASVGSGQVELAAGTVRGISSACGTCSTSGSEACDPAGGAGGQYP